MWFLSFLYNIVLLLASILYVPINAFHILWQGKAKRWVFSRLYVPSLPKLEEEVIWLHAASLGETKALLTLIPEIKKDYPEARVVLSVITVAGYLEAKKHTSLFQALFYLPLDFSWVMKRLVKHISPKLLILVEGDFWLHMVYYAKRYGAKVALASGSISTKSVERYLLVPVLRKALFSHIDAYGVQSEQYSERFMKLGIDKEKVAVTGNIKLSASAFQERSVEQGGLPLDEGVTLVTVGCSHPGEEEGICEALLPLLKKYPSLVLAFAPRHLNRVAEVHKKLAALVGACDLLSEGSIIAQVVVIDKMGILDQWYQRSQVAIMGGSFFPGVGGHNIFEPIVSGAVPVFGPHMESQQDLANLVLDAGAGLSVSLQDLEKGVANLLTNKPYRDEVKQSGAQLQERAQQTANLTWQYIHTHTVQTLLT